MYTVVGFRMTMGRLNEVKTHLRFDKNKGGKPL